MFAQCCIIPEPLDIKYSVTVALIPGRDIVFRLLSTVYNERKLSRRLWLHFAFL